MVNALPLCAKGLKVSTYT